MKTVIITKQRQRNFSHAIDIKAYKTEKFDMLMVKKYRINNIRIIIK